MSIHAVMNSQPIFFVEGLLFITEYMPQNCHWKNRGDGICSMHMHWFFFRLTFSWLKRLTLSADWWHSSDSSILKIPSAGVDCKGSMQLPVNL